MDHLKEILTGTLWDEMCDNKSLMIDSYMNSIDTSCFLGDGFYFPNMCHVCHRFGVEVNLKRCGACGMISYCGQEHQKKDWPSHKEFCLAVRDLKKEWKVDNLFESLKATFPIMPLKNIQNIQNKYEYYALMFKLHERLTLALSSKLKRKLRLAELQIISYPRVCAVCFESKNELLTNCKLCPQASFCGEHKNDKNHESECPKILSCFVTTGKKYEFPDKLMSDLKNSSVSALKSKSKKLPSTMLEFIEMRLRTDLKIITNLSKEVKFAYNAHSSEIYTGPLTLLFAIEKLALNEKNHLVIHLVGATSDEQSINWGIMLHYLPKLQHLELILIGPQLLSHEMSRKLCNERKNGKQKLTIKIKKLVYDEYISEVTFKKPDLIVCFNPGFHVYPSWKKSVEIFNKGQCPLIITAYCQIEGLVDRDMLERCFPMAKSIYCDYNPFASLLYLRSNVIKQVGCDNQFMILYEHLET